MIHIVLCCAAAMSTSLLVEKIKREADQQDIFIDICAYGVHDICHQGAHADIILLAPQVKYMKKQIQKTLPDIPIMDISMRDYGTMNGKNVFQAALKTLQEQS
ncbi:PTS sugar transporter subunit IIB [Allocoprobacillus halotolerans]|uniref:PTS sugar transporter subunit IIB n=1 Tax=Allocoprobacillus halotolerans TaxID=2944914 RepID=A0ABY5I476_9FIRM|nr:PTS sugar transporter subunit IIB [Allocoprobacillus halotolerans]UTY39194.1 PTS sugar transporter subunit IIB [Allocoprobacillus halotolerans]